MKKIAAFIAAIITSIILCIMPFNAYADNVQLSDIQSYYDLFENYGVTISSASNNYFAFTRYYSSFGADYTEHYLVFYENDDSYISFSDTNGIYEITDNTWLDHLKVYYLNKSSGDTSYQLTQMTGGKFIFNTNNNTVYFETTSHNVRMDSITMYNFACSFDDVDPIEVKLFPELTEQFNYTASATIADEYYTMEVNSLQVDIINHSNKAYQYAILIQPRNSYLDTDNHSNSRNTTVFWGDSEITYALFKDEWIYVPGTFNSNRQLVNTPSAWHYLPASDMKREQIYYDQMQLKAGVQYTFKVIAFELSQYSLTYDEPYAVAVAPIITDDTSNTYDMAASVVYSVDFSVIYDTKFDPTSTANGAYSFDNTAPLDTQFDRIKAIVNSNGDVEITEGADYSKVYQNASSGSSSSSSGSYVGSNSKSYNNLITNSSSYLALCKNVLRYFPDWVIDIAFWGLLGIVVVFILKKL